MAADLVSELTLTQYQGDGEAFVTFWEKEKKDHSRLCVIAEVMIYSSVMEYSHFFSTSTINVLKHMS